MSNARPLRVLVVSHLALPHVGGVENLVDLEIQALADEGHEVRLLTSNGTGAGRDPAYPSNVSVERVPAWHILERKLGIPYPLFGPRLLTQLRDAIDWADVVHAHGFLFTNTSTAVWLARLMGKPCVLTDHGGIQRFGSRVATLTARFGAETVGRLSARLATRVITYNERIRRQLGRLGSRRDVEFLPNPVNRDLFHPPTPTERQAARRALGWDETRPKVLFVGRLIPTKGVPLLLASADPAFDLVFCGPGDNALLGPLPRPGVEYLPPRPQCELVPLYHAADVLVLPAEVREGFPLVVQEALCCGLKVVLGYDPGFEPYRQLSHLTFCERTPDDVRSKIRSALAAPIDEDISANLFPSFESWIHALYQLPKSTAAIEQPELLTT